MERMLEELKGNWILLLNAGLIILGTLVPGVKDLLTPEFEATLIAAINGVIALVRRLKELNQ